ncbi:hypothetical protein RF11_08359 [Thelohanellus kitauei]|uniref:Uncharacterized protein n=1 Tax=Thelohanellus kitauei TaxID=669202 RepID=A0A0C2J1J8_THEKT|nr:hypothetical protein RF11_08359 [Thelohanellus kitauei]
MDLKLYSRKTQKSDTTMSDKEDGVKLVFIDDDIREGSFGTENVGYGLEIDKVIDVQIHKNLVLVVLVEQTKDWASVWMAEIHDLNFAKISANMYGIDTTYSAESLYIKKIEYFVGVFDKLPGTIYVSEITHPKHSGIEKMSAVSFNYGKSFLPLRYNMNSEPIGWVR